LSCHDRRFQLNDFHFSAELFLCFLAGKLTDFVPDFKHLFCFKVYSLKLKKIIFQQKILNVYNLPYSVRFFRHNFKIKKKLKLMKFDFSNACFSPYWTPQPINRTYFTPCFPKSDVYSNQKTQNFINIPFDMYGNYYCFSGNN